MKQTLAKRICSSIGFNWQGHASVGDRICIGFKILSVVPDLQSGAVLTADLKSAIRKIEIANLDQRVIKLNEEVSY